MDPKRLKSPRMASLLFTLLMSVFTLSGRVSLAGESLPYLEQVEIVSSWEQLGDTATLSVPRNLKLGDRRIEEVINRGNAISIELGYDGNLVNVFGGYITRIYPGVPLRIEAQDEAYKLRQSTYNLSYKSVNLRQLAADIAPGYNIEARDIELGKFIVRDVSAAKVLQELRSKYSLPSFFRDNTLYIGSAYPLTNPPVHRYDFRENVDGDRSRLEWRGADDYKLQVKAISILADNTKIETTVGESGGETRTMHFAGITSEAELKKLAQERLSSIRVEGLSGSLMTFGSPRPQHGDIAELLNNPFNDNEGRYYIDKVVTRFGDGYSHELTLGQNA